MVEYNLKITKWPKDERPRERLLRRGPHGLSDAELLGILIAKGTKDKTKGKVEVYHCILV